MIFFKILKKLKYNSFKINEKKVLLNFIVKNIKFSY